jgi:hypothetical protein
MVFRGYTLFGISIMSLLSSLIFGYGIHSAVPDSGDATPESVPNELSPDQRATPQSE